MSQPIVVVIPTYERSGVLARTLPSYTTQRGVREVILVDDGGSPANSQRLHQLAASEGNCRVIRNTRREGQPSARMRGVSESSSPFVFFGEDDVLLCAGFLETLASHAKASRADMTAGAVVYLHPKETMESALVRYYSQPIVSTVQLDRALLYRSSDRLPDDIATPFLPGLMLVRQEVFGRIAFDDAYAGNAFREETDFAIRANRSGFSATRCPHAVSFHLSRQDVPGGGQHRMPGWRYEVSAIMNNWRFLSRHGDYLRSCFGVDRANLALQWRFVQERALSVLRAKRAARAG